MLLRLPGASGIRLKRSPSSVWRPDLYFSFDIKIWYRFTDLKKHHRFERDTGTEQTWGREYHTYLSCCTPRGIRQCFGSLVSWYSGRRKIVFAYRINGCNAICKNCSTIDWGILHMHSSISLFMKRYLKMFLIWPWNNVDGHLQRCIFFVEKCLLFNLKFRNKNVILRADKSWKGIENGWMLDLCRPNYENYLSF